VALKAAVVVLSCSHKMMGKSEFYSFWQTLQHHYEQTNTYSNREAKNKTKQTSKIKTNEQVYYEI
jgi:hypothetical protein